MSPHLIILIFSKVGSHAWGVFSRQLAELYPSRIERLRGMDWRSAVTLYSGPRLKPTQSGPTRWSGRGSGPPYTIILTRLSVTSRPSESRNGMLSMRWWTRDLTIILFISTILETPASELMSTNMSEIHFRRQLSSSATTESWRINTGDSGGVQIMIFSLDISLFQL